MLCYTIFNSTLSAMGADGPFIALGVNLTPQAIGGPAPPMAEWVDLKLV